MLVWGYHTQIVSVVVPKPIRLSARDAKLRAAQVVKVFSDLVKGTAFAVSADANFVQSIYEECLARPLRMTLYVECYEIAS